MDNQKEGFPKVLNLLLWKTMQMENTCQILNWKVITSSHLSSNVKNCIYLPIDSEMSLWWNGKHELNDHEGQGFSLLLESVKRKNKCSINTARCITYLHLIYMDVLIIYILTQTAHLLSPQCPVLIIYILNFFTVWEDLQFHKWNVN